MVPHTWLWLLASLGSCTICSSVPRIACNQEAWICLDLEVQSDLDSSFVAPAFSKHKIKRQPAEQCVCVCVCYILCVHVPRGFSLLPLAASQKPLFSCSHKLFSRSQNCFKATHRRTGKEHIQSVPFLKASPLGYCLREVFFSGHRTYFDVCVPLFPCGLLLSPIL